MENWVDVGPADEFEADGKQVVEAGGRHVVVCRLEEQWYAVSNVCPHAGMPIGHGELRGCVLTCPYHGFAYDVKTGRNVDYESDMPLRQYPVKVELGQVLIDTEPPRDDA